MLGYMAAVQQQQRGQRRQQAAANGSAEEEEEEQGEEGAAEGGSDFSGSDFSGSAGGEEEEEEAGGHAAAAAAAGAAAAADDPASDSSEDEREGRNTVGDVPLEWYKGEAHIGYDREGRRLDKRGGRDMLDKLLARADGGAGAWRTVYDEYNDEEIVLSKEEMRMIQRIRAGTCLGLGFRVYRVREQARVWGGAAGSWRQCCTRPTLAACLLASHPGPSTTHPLACEQASSRTWR